MENLFFICFGLMVILSIRGVSIAGKIKEEIGFKESSFQLHYIIQNQVASKNPYPLELKTAKAIELYDKCILNLRLMFLVVLIFTVTIFIFE